MTTPANAKKIPSNLFHLIISPKKITYRIVTNGVPSCNKIATDEI